MDNSWPATPKRWFGTSEPDAGLPGRVDRLERAARGGRGAHGIEDAHTGDADSEHRWMAMELEPYTALARAFYTAIDGGEPGPVAPATFTDGVAGMRVLDAMRASAAAGGALQAVDPSR